MSIKKASEPDELDNERSTLMHETTKDLSGREIPLCGFMSVQYYQPYFDVDTDDIYQRLIQSSFFCRREKNFLAFIGDKPDAYGPFWVSKSHHSCHICLLSDYSVFFKKIATTLVFVLAVTSHLNGWFTSWIKGATM